MLALWPQFILCLVVVMRVNVQEVGWDLKGPSDSFCSLSSGTANPTLFMSASLPVWSELL